METLKPYIGSYMDTSIFLNSGKYGWYLNHEKIHPRKPNFRPLILKT